jgi:hypothetical protein
MFNCSILSNIWYVRLQLSGSGVMNGKHSGMVTHCVVLLPNYGPINVTYYFLFCGYGPFIGFCLFVTRNQMSLLI